MRKFALLAALALAVGACQPRSAPLMATADYEQQVRKIDAPPSDRARLYIFTGKQQAHALLTTTRCTTSRATSISTRPGSGRSGLSRHPPPGRAASR